METTWAMSIVPLIDKLNAIGVTWDWINDESLQVLNTNGRSSESHANSLADGRVVTDEGKANGTTLQCRGNEYQGLILFNAPFIQLESAKRLNALARQGANIVVMGDAPRKQPSYMDYEANDKLTAAQMAEMMQHPQVKAIDSSANLSPWISSLQMPVRTLSSSDNMRQTRRMMDDGNVAQFYWNESEEWQEVNLEIDKQYPYAYWMNPEDGSIAPAAISETGRLSHVFGPLTTVFLFCSKSPIATEKLQANPSSSAYMQATEVARVNYADVVADSLQLVNHPIGDWRHDEQLQFNGEDVTYTFTVNVKKKKQTTYYIDLGKVCYSAEMTVENQEVGKRIYTPFLFDVTKQLKNGINRVTVKVTPSKYNEFVKRGKDGDRLFKMLMDSELAAEGIIGPVRVLMVNQKQK